MGRDIAEDSSLINENGDDKSVEIVSPRGEEDGIVKKLKSHSENGIIGLLNNGGHRGNSYGVGAFHGGRSSHESGSDEHGLLGKVTLKKKKKKNKKKKQKIRKKKKKKYPSTISVVHDEYFAENSNEPYSEHQYELTNDNYSPDTNNDHYNLVDLVDWLPDPPNLSKPKKMKKLKMKKIKKGKPGKKKYGRDIGGIEGGLKYSFYL